MNSAVICRPSDVAHLSTLHDPLARLGRLGFPRDARFPGLPSRLLCRFDRRFGVASLCLPDLVRSPHALSNSTPAQSDLARVEHSLHSPAIPVGLSCVAGLTRHRSYLPALPASISSTALPLPLPKPASTSVVPCTTTFLIIVVLHRPVEFTNSQCSILNPGKKRDRFSLD